MNPMQELTIAKVVLNIGVGEAGERLGKAEIVLTKLSGCKPVRTLSKSTKLKNNFSWRFKYDY